jgi:CelD/BcsL family acetyltransferase involved in cellulose biosynthesis
MSGPPLRLELRGRLGPLAPSWDALVDRQGLPTPFLKSWWLEHAAGGTPTILCVLEGAELVGGAAFEVDHVGPAPVAVERVRVLGQGVLAPDHLDLLSEPSRAREVREIVLGWLHRPGSRLIDLDGLAAGGVLAQAYAAAEIERVGAPYAPLPATGAEYLAARPGKLRSTITRRGRAFERDGATLRRVPAEQVDAALDRLAELHEHRWSDESSFLDGWGAVRAAACDGARNGEVVVTELVAADGEVVATELDLLAGRRAAFYQAGRRTDRDWRGCGSVVRAEFIDRCCEDGLVEYDLLRGDESYKADWATERRELVRCRRGVGPRGRALEQALRAWRRSAPQVQRGRDAVAQLVSRAPWRPRRAARHELSG